MRQATDASKSDRAQHWVQTEPQRMPARDGWRTEVSTIDAMGQATASDIAKLPAHANDVQTREYVVSRFAATDGRKATGNGALNSSDNATGGRQGAMVGSIPTARN